MSAIHEQAMTYVYQQMLQRLLDFYSRAERTAIQLLVQRLIVAAGGVERVGDYRVLMVQTGSRESFYVLTALRAAQLTIAGRYPATFSLRVVTPRMGDISQATLENIHRCYSALFVYDDPRVELLMADNREVTPFNHSKPLSTAARDANRTDLLMFGHLRSPDSLLGLGDEGYLAMAEFYRNMARWGTGVDSWVSSDTPRQQKQFMTGLQRASRRFGLVIEPSGGFDGLFAQLDAMGGELFRQFYGQENIEPWRPEGRFEACRRLGRVSIDDLIVDRLEESNWSLFGEFLGVRPDGLVAPTLDHEYLSPYLSAHLYGLQACYLQGRSYEHGYGDYVQRTIMIMHRKQLPMHICQQVQELFGSPSAMPERRAQAAAEAQETLGLSEMQLVCMLHAPFIGNGAGLENYLRCCHPDMLFALPELRNAIEGGPATEEAKQWLYEVSGLPVALLNKVYQSPIAVSEQPIVTVSARRSVPEAPDSSEDEQRAREFYERWAR
jgi:hypothetical protein